MLFFILVFIFLAFWNCCAAFNASRCNSSKWMTVETSSGQIQGHAAPNCECVIEYLGIPYAEPPLGDLRFAPPKRLIRNHPYQALNFVSYFNILDFTFRVFQLQNVVEKTLPIQALNLSERKLRAYFSTFSSSCHCEVIHRSRQETRLSNCTVLIK